MYRIHDSFRGKYIIRTTNWEHTSKTFLFWKKEHFSVTFRRWSGKITLERQNIRKKGFNIKHSLLDQEKSFTNKVSSSVWWFSFRNSCWVLDSSSLLVIFFFVSPFILWCSHITSIIRQEKPRGSKRRPNENEWIAIKRKRGKERMPGISSHGCVVIKWETSK